MSMKKKLKKLLMFGLATIMTLSFSMLAFAGANSGEAPLGEYGTMYFNIYVNGSSAQAEMDTDMIGSLSIDGEANYLSVWDSDTHAINFYGGEDNTSHCLASTNVDGSDMYYAQATFSAYANFGGYNSVFLNCTN